MNTYDFSEYYTAVKVAEILGLEKNTILARCRNGNYEGAIKTTPDVHPPHGQWLVPKALIDTPHMVKDVVNFTRQINPLELERSITNAISRSIIDVVEPLQRQLDEQAEIIKNLQNIQAKNVQTVISAISEARAADQTSLQEINTELSRIRTKKEEGKNSGDWAWKNLFFVIVLFFLVIVGSVFVALKFFN